MKDSRQSEFTPLPTDQRAAWPGVELAYGTRGERGSPVLLVTGFGVPGRAWVHQVPALAEAHRVAWYDHRGCGDSVAPPGRYTMALLACVPRLGDSKLDSILHPIRGRVPDDRSGLRETFEQDPVPMGPALLPVPLDRQQGQVR